MLKNKRQPECLKSTEMLSIDPIRTQRRNSMLLTLYSCHSTARRVSEQLQFGRRMTPFSTTLCFKSKFEIISEDQRYVETCSLLFFNHRFSARSAITRREKGQLVDTMKAAVICEAGGPEVLKIEQRPVPKPKSGEVLVRVKAFGRNRSELFTRRGYSPHVRFPRVLGIEAVGLVEDALGASPARAMTAMGGMGRLLDNGYAEYTRVAAKQFWSVTTRLPWETLAALPEMLQTAWGSLFKSLRLDGACGHATPKDSLRCARQRGIVCMTGIVGDKWSFDNFSPMEVIPTAVSLTTYAGKSEDLRRAPFGDLIELIEAGTLRVQAGRTFTLDEIVEAHRCMEETTRVQRVSR